MSVFFCTICFLWKTIYLPASWVSWYFHSCTLPFCIIWRMIVFSKHKTVVSGPPLWCFYNPIYSTNMCQVRKSILTTSHLFSFTSRSNSLSPPPWAPQEWSSDTETHLAGFQHAAAIPNDLERSIAVPTYSLHPRSLSDREYELGGGKKRKEKKSHFAERKSV